MTNTKTKSTVALAAQDIRAALKTAFAGTKFSVRSESFSMGNAVRIEWVDGPSSKQVEAVVGRFEAGSFDGMTDMYNNAAKDPSTPHRAKYVTCTREISPEVSRAVRERIEAMCGGDELPEWKRDQVRSDETWRALQDSDLRTGYKDVIVSGGRFVVVSKEKS